MEEQQKNTSEDEDDADPSILAVIGTLRKRAACLSFNITRLARIQHDD